MVFVDFRSEEVEFLVSRVGSKVETTTGKIGIKTDHCIPTWGRDGRRVKNQRCIYDLSVSYDRGKD